MINKKVLASVLTLGVIISVGYFSSTNVLAEGVTTGKGHDQLISAIAQKFNLNTSDVEAVFTAVHDERLEEMKNVRNDRLSQAVTDGVITEEQKKSIIEKMETHMENRNMAKEDLQKWFSDNGIDSNELKPYMMFKFRHFRSN